MDAVGKHYAVPHGSSGLAAISGGGNLPGRILVSGGTTCTVAGGSSLRRGEPVAELSTVPCAKCEVVTSAQP